MSVKEFALPDLGEGLTESEVVAWRVAVGDMVELNQIIAEVETAKALVEVPSPFAGIVRELHAEPGETLEVGAPLMSVEVEGEDDGDGGRNETPDDASLLQADATAESPRMPQSVGAAAARASESRPVVAHDGGRPRVVGGAAAGAGPDRRPTSDDDRDPVSDAEPASPAGSPNTGPGVEPDEPEERHQVLVGRGPRAQSARRPQRKPRSGRLPEPIAWQRPEGVGDASGHEAGETRSPATGIRRRTAEAMVRSAAVPQVTEFLSVDVTRSMHLIDRLGSSPELRGRRVTVLTLAAKALCLALSATPEANSHWDDATGEIVAPHGVNLGIAVATDRGLVVPNIRSADGMRMPELADAVTALVERARTGRTTPAEFTGGTITITNVGVFGVDAGTPLLNPGETAILALGAVGRRPWEHKGRVRLRHVMTLSLTFDHRVIDGEQGSRLLRDLGRILSDPASSLALA
ncbi:dihydrolipoamide acetyltransferase family protein [Rathayibacter sp. KR2-224]|uniref:dihydrolipoamide acetyltransferase family protein n=1 Tax=Rathayibacter sp. KR2-224 TaxID=3400913 RepID=UPI003C0890F1